MAQVLIDTNVCSLALRRRRPETLTELEDRFRRDLRLLVARGLACLIGAVRQELLSGCRHPEQFRRVQAEIVGLPLLSLEAAIYDRAAEFANACRAAGVAQDATDMLLCAAAETYELPILTLDGDFLRYARHLPVRLRLPEP